MNIKEELNTFFVGCFYSILKQEENSLEGITNGKLSLKEIHVIEAIKKTMNKGDNTHNGVAKMLDITPGSLTVAVNVLEKKGYVAKKGNEKDKRVTHLELSSLGEYINSCHDKYHEEMIAAVVKITNIDEQKILISSLKKLHEFFKGHSKIKL